MKLISRPTNNKPHLIKLLSFVVRNMTDKVGVCRDEDIFDAERRKKDTERRKNELEEQAKKQKNYRIKKFIADAGDRVVSFYDSSFLAVQPPKSWNPNKDVGAAILSNPLSVFGYLDNICCGYADDRVEREPQSQPQQAANVETKVEIHEGLDVPDVRRIFDYVKSTDQIKNEICDITIANARKEFLTREALEDAISKNIEEAEAGNEKADEELRRIFPFRFVLPTAADQKEMIDALKKKKTVAMKHVNLREANEIQAEIDELEYQVHMEETYIQKKKLSETECVACGQIFSNREVKPGEMLHCKECRQVFGADADDASETFTLTKRPLKSPLSIKVVNNQGNII